jgi:hypothetical protein
MVVHRDNIPKSMRMQKNNKIKNNKKKSPKKFSTLDNFLDGVLDDFNFNEFILPVLKLEPKDFFQFIKELEN